jgi:hypothetical protein
MKELEIILNEFPFKNAVMAIAGQKDKDGSFKNRWLWNKDKVYFEMIQEHLKKLNITLDGKHATITSKGLTFDYIVYKNRLLQNYPKATIDLDLVFEGDTFEIRKESGKIIYNHEIANPFGKTLKSVIGGYCIVRIPDRGEFQTTMGLEELDKHKELSNMKYLYNSWWQELYKKTLLRKNLKFHFEDEFEDIQKIDDEGMDNQLSESKELTTEQIEKKLSKVKTKADISKLWTELSEVQQSDYRDKFNEKSKTLK